MTFIKKFIVDHPFWTIIILAILAYIIYKIIDGQIKKAKARKNYNATVNQSQDALNQLADQGVKPSYGQAQYSSWADAIQKGFEGCGGGWSSILKPTLQAMKNDADVYALIQNYGVRTFDECGWGSFEGDLAAAIGYKFSGFRFCDAWLNPTCEKCGCVSEINKILKSKGIVFQF